MTAQDLARIPLFARLSPAEREALGALMARKRFAADTTVFFQDDPSDSLHIVLSGSAKVYRTSEDGKEHILSTLRPGDSFGELAMIEGLPRSASVQAVEDTEMLFLARRDFEAFARDHPQVLWGLLQALCERLRKVTEDELDPLFHDVPYRVLRTFSLLLERHGESGAEGWRILFPLSVGELACMVGSNSETVSRLIQGYERDGLVRRDGDTWVVPERRALARALEYASTAS
jgi:CRP/FNR family transcriptional regulator, cyclic AMP receptor protein